MTPTANTQKIVDLIIDNIEGGYYHPDMKSKLRGGENMLDSGETMFGIDRKAGAPQFTTRTQYAVQFWQVVDSAFGSHHGDTGYYNDKADGTKKVAASVGAQLRPLVNYMIVDAYNSYSKYLGEGAKRIVENDPKLLLQFMYAVWNGPGNFQKFANLLNTAYSNGNKSAAAYWDIVQDARRAKGSLFATGANKLDAIANNLTGGGAPVWAWVLGIGGILTVILMNSNNKKSKRK